MLARVSPYCENGKRVQKWRETAMRSYAGVLHVENGTAKITCKRRDGRTTPDLVVITEIVINSDWMSITGKERVNGELQDQFWYIRFTTVDIPRSTRCGEEAESE
ncbi:hypothetical protein [Undibacterium sp.]|uniref:hypothetical protein n=1 Tax=Undibacterium sp. TaxID=1914977 RepID=UPI00374DED56